MTKIGPDYPAPASICHPKNTYFHSPEAFNENQKFMLSLWSEDPGHFRFNYPNYTSIFILNGRDPKRLRSTLWKKLSDLSQNMHIAINHM